MLDRFKRFIKDHQLIGSYSKLLLAVSGGVDSMVLMHLMQSLSFKFHVAHCNFGLRGSESDEDENFVKSIAQKSNVTFHVKKFDTKNFAESNGMGIQEAARVLRYKWFDQLDEENGYDYIVTAHHADDLAETVLLNITRGTGIAGLHGILSRRGKIIRPLLFAKRNEVEAFASEEKIEFREDSSNSDLKYSRNIIRQKVIPVLKELNPALVDSISKHAEIVTDVESILDHYCKNFLSSSNVSHSSDDEMLINSRELLASPGARYLLFRIIQPFGFNPSVCSDIYRAITSRRTGEVFYSSSHKVIHDRDRLIIQKVALISDDEEYLIHTDDDGMLMRFGSLDITKFPDTSLNNWLNKTDFGNKNVAVLDLDKISYPLTVRTWKQGDQFKPLGMNGKKLISDYYTDIKLPSHLKSKTYLVLSGSDIVWVSGHRIDERYKVTSKTANTIKLKLLSR
jgi:tRNA(Ile)-lysidine synthase